MLEGLAGASQEAESSGSIWQRKMIFIDFSLIFIDFSKIFIVFYGFFIAFY